MITKIGFKNFRRFKEYTEVDLGDINMFVGGNNAGKSTVVKALLLVTDFLKNNKVTTRSKFETPKFSFGTEHVNIDSYNRAKNWDAKDEDIVFYVTLDHFDVTISLFHRSVEDQPDADIKSIEVYDALSDVDYTFYVGESKTQIILDARNGKERQLGNSDSIELEELRKEIEKLESSIASNFGNSSAGNDVIASISNLTQLKAKYAEIETNAKKECNKVDMMLSQDLGTIGRDYISSLLYGIAENVVAEDNKHLLPRLDVFSISAKKFEDSVKNINTEYIYAHSAIQKVLFNKKDNNDYIAQRINELNTLKITSKSTVGELFCKWLKEFTGIDNYCVQPVGGGEGFTFAVRYKGQWHDLGDMGRGTIQLVTLFMHLAIILKKNEYSTVKPIVMVEEPEQNLHPAVQEMLTDLFEELQREYNLNFIIETHSEYMIRRVQILMAKLFKKVSVVNATMHVHYFPSKGVPYDMGFKNNGKFCKSFEPGFFNVADDASIELFELEEEE